MMINLHCIASGSKGNASLIFDDKTLILVDLGRLIVWLRK